MKFAYVATNKEGKTVRGTGEAVDRSALFNSLAKQGLRPVIIKLAGVKSGTHKRSKKVKLKELVIFTRQLSTMISAGVPLTRALSTMQTQAESKYFKQVIGGVTKDIEGGMALGDAFSKYPTVFSEVYINMIRAGETGGILDEILKRLAAQVEQDSSMRKKIKSAAMYPMVIFSITIIAFFGIMIFVIPKIAKILNDLGGPNAKLPVYTRALLGISGFMQHYAIFVGIGLFAIIYVTRRYIKTPAGKYKFHALLLRTPILKGVIVKVAVARFARTFASLMSAGVSVLDALEVTGGAIGNKVIEGELKEAAKAVKNGKQLSEPLKDSKHFPAIVSQMLAIGEETGQIDTILVKVADFYEEEVEVLIDGLSALIEPLMIVVLGALVGIIAASVMGPIASLSKNIGNN
ncbi:MAG TPA: type II secretion system F family protein [Candidatus Saccharimonadales bacterium]|nr:type II secretion system F family protein [Candidatus Saccharimonadales bacterium]